MYKTLLQGKPFKKNRELPDTVEPPNKGHVGDNINSVVLSFIERLSSFRGSKTIGHVILGPQTVSFVERVIIQCPYFRGSIIRGSTV